MAESSAKTIIDTGDLAQIEAGRRVVVEYLEEAHALERALVTNLKAHRARSAANATRKAAKSAASTARLSPADIRKVATYERNHKKRTGVLEHVDSKLKEKASS